MLKINLNEKESILLLELNGALNQNDFKEVSKIVDPFIEKSGKLNGIIINVESFPGWDSFSALMKHIKFVNEHHKKVSKIAFVTDSIVGDFAQHIGSHFVNAKVKHFGFKEFENAKKWIIENANKIVKHGISIGINRVNDEFLITFKAIGKLTHKDYEIITPMIENALKGINKPKVKMLVDIQDFNGWEARAAWDDFKIGVDIGFDFDKIAIFGSHNKLIDYTVKVSSWFLNESIQEFTSEKEAIDWLNE